MSQLDEPYILDYAHLVEKFHRKFGVPVGERPALLSQEDFEFRVKFMQEELEEYIIAHINGDMVKAFDALIDLEYVLLGTSRWHGFPHHRGFLMVHNANMQKMRAESAESSKASSGRGHAFDVIKPPGWTPPEDILRALLIQHGAEL